MARLVLTYIVPAEGKGLQGSTCIHHRPLDPDIVKTCLLETKNEAKPSIVHYCIGACESTQVVGNASNIPAASCTSCTGTSQHPPAPLLARLASARRE